MPSGDSSLKSTSTSAGATSTGATLAGATFTVGEGQGGREATEGLAGVNTGLGMGPGGVAGRRRAGCGLSTLDGVRELVVRGGVGGAGDSGGRVGWPDGGV
jgi:fermentation-respiration switch protein FrsA (DUF1100 family)